MRPLLTHANNAQNALGDAMVNTFFPNAISFYTGDLVGFEE